MSIKVSLSPNVHQAAGGQPSVQVEAGSVREAMFKVSGAYPALRLINCDGELRSIIKVSRNGQSVAMDDSLADGDELLLST